MKAKDMGNSETKDFNSFEEEARVLVMSRDGAQVHLQNLKTALADQQKQSEKIEKKLASKIGEMQDAIGKGEDFTKIDKDVIALRIEKEHIQGIVTILETDSIPKADETLRLANQKLLEGVKRLLIELREGYRSQVNEEISGALNKAVSYIEFAESTIKKYGLQYFMKSFEFDEVYSFRLNIGGGLAQGHKGLMGLDK